VITPHPIEIESYRLLDQRVDLSHLTPAVRAVVARVIHATADTDYAHTMVLDEDAVLAGVHAMRAGAPVVTDVEMVSHGITGTETVCYLKEIESTPVTGPTRSARAMALAARRHPAGAVVVVGCAPTALLEAVGLATEEAFTPALIIGLPVGFVGAADAKAAARASGLPTITNVGDKGGSAVAAAAVNAIVRLAQGPRAGDDRG
jgi:precorrin-8X/cobalt-precorrin-8 methylmutase